VVRADESDRPEAAEGVVVGERGRNSREVDQDDSSRADLDDDPEEVAQEKLSA
jgi:hypothetical protein